MKTNDNEYLLGQILGPWVGSNDTNNLPAYFIDADINDVADLNMLLLNQIVPNVKSMPPSLYDVCKQFIDSACNGTTYVDVKKTFDTYLIALDYPFDSQRFLCAVRNVCFCDNAS
jgi:hypothetical protein